MELLTIIVPVYNEEDCIDPFIERIQKSLVKNNKKFLFEILFINNASTDNTLVKIQKCAKRFSNIYWLTQSRNFGYQSSLLLGLTKAKGDVFCIIDVDCEDPPELISEFLKYYDDGYDLIYGRRNYGVENLFIKLCRKLFYRLTHKIADWEFVIDMAEFSVFSQRIRKVVLNSNSTFPFLRSQFAFAGYKRKGINYTRQTRVSGNSSYNVPRMFLFAASGILSSSTFPLRLINYIFALLLLSLFTYTIVRNYSYMVIPIDILLLFVFTIHMFCFSVISI